MSHTALEERFKLESSNQQTSLPQKCADGKEDGSTGGGRLSRRGRPAPGADTVHRCWVN